MSQGGRFVLAGFGVLVMFGSVAARADIPIELTAQWGGPARAAAVAGDLAYIGIGHRLVVLDCSDPGHPALLGQTDTLPGPISGIAVADNYACVTFWGELWVFDVSTPAAPEPAGSLVIGGEARNVLVSGNLAYVADGAGDAGNPGGLKIVDITDPHSPSLLGGLDTAGETRAVAVQGSYAYLADGPGGLVIADVTDPSNPSQVSVLAMPDEACGVAVIGQYAYVADSFNGGFRIVDVSDPEHPAEVGHCSTDGAPLDVVVEGNYAYVANAWLGLGLIDISDPGHPAKVGELIVAGWAMRAALSAGKAWLAAETGGLQVIDRSAVPALSFVGEYRTGVSGDTSDVAIAGYNLYVSDGLAGGGVEVLAVGDPANPQKIGHVESHEYSWGLSQVVGNLLYLADGCAGSAMIDVTNPTNPQRAGNAETGCASRDAWIDGDYAYVADDHQSLLVIDISDSSNPHLVGSWQDPAAPGYALGVTKSGNYVYLANGPVGLEVIDVSNPSHPSRVGHWSTSGYANDVAVSGDYAYVATTSGGLEVIQIADPENPTGVGACTAFGDGQGVVVKGRYAFVAAGGDGLQLVDVSDPANPIRVGQKGIVGFSRRVAVSGMHAYVAAGDNGVVILKIGGDYVWNKPAGGDFVTPENWDPAGPPDPFGRAVFNLSNAYTVTMPPGGGVVHDRLLVNGGDVSIDLNNQTYTLQHEWDESPSVAVADDQANPVTAWLTVYNGADNGVAAHELEVGRWPDNNGTLVMSDIRWDAVDYFFTIGVAGYGTVTLEQSRAAYRYGWLGFYPGSEGTLTLTASRWDLGLDQELVVGREGQGTMTLQEGSQSNMGRLTVARMNGSNGNFSVQSSSTVTASGPMVIAQEGGQAVVEVSDYGVLAVNGRGAGNPEDSVGLVVVENGGSGELNILSGGSVAVQYICTIGGWSPPEVAGLSSGVTCDATLLVDGDESLLEAPHTLEIGRDACGTATVTNSGTVTTGLAFIGLRAHGDLTVTGADSSFTAANITRVGGADGAEGYVTVTDGAHVTSEHQIQVGYEGTGSTQVTQGGVLASYKADSPTGTSGIIAWQTTGIGTVVVTNPGSRWTQDGSLSVGWFGHGTLDVADSGSVESAAGVVARMPGSVGTVTVRDAISKWAVSGPLSVGGLMGAAGGTGELNVNDGGGVTVGTELKVWSGGSIHLDGGRMTVGTGEMPVSANTIAVYAGGTLSGTGTVGGDVAVLGGTVSPGTSLGTLPLEDNYSQDASSTLSIELGGSGAGQYDRLSVAGTASLGGTLALSLAGGYEPSAGDSFVILTCASRVGRFATVIGANVGSKRLAVVYNSNNVTVTLVTAADFDGDGDVDLTDFLVFQGCFNGPNRSPAATGCAAADFDLDNDVDLADFLVFQGCFNGPNRPPACAG
jgi:T5SS/PEP-CTERM-associated repeat protein